MPQLTQLPDVILSQLFWLAVTLGFIYFVIGRGMVPKILSTIDRRDQMIASDLAAAEKAKADADAIEEAYRQRLDASRAEALKVTTTAKQESAKAVETKIAAANASAQKKLDEAAARILAARQAAQAEVADVAAEMAREIVGKVTGVAVAKADALAAVQAEAVNG